MTKAQTVCKDCRCKGPIVNFKKQSYKPYKRDALKYMKFVEEHAGHRVLLLK